MDAPSSCRCRLRRRIHLLRIHWRRCLESLVLRSCCCLRRYCAGRRVRQGLRYYCTFEPSRGACSPLAGPPDLVAEDILSLILAWRCGQSAGQIVCQTDLHLPAVVWQERETGKSRYRICTNQAYDGIHLGNVATEMFDTLTHSERHAYA